MLVCLQRYNIYFQELMRGDVKPGSIKGQISTQTTSFADVRIPRYPGTLGFKDLLQQVRIFLTLNTLRFKPK